VLPRCSKADGCQIVLSLRGLSGSARPVRLCAALQARPFLDYACRTYALASAKCKSLKGAYLISYNSGGCIACRPRPRLCSRKGPCQGPAPAPAPATAGAEQLAVENRFRLTGALTYYYWLGVERSGNLYYLQVSHTWCCDACSSSLHAQPAT
jgi:hypothetical protein